MLDDDSQAKIRILLVDDHRIVREGIAAVLEAEQNMEVIGGAGSGEEALEMVKTLQPDVVVMDLQMPGIGGLAATRHLKQSHPTISVVVLTVDNAEAVLLEAVRAGAAGYVLKDASSDTLVKTIRLALRGGSVIDSRLLLKALRAVGPTSEEPALSQEGLDPLTPRELEVLKLLARGLGNQEIADQLGLSRMTAKKHVHHIITKLHVSDRTQAALVGVRMGLLK